jgi:hypothetical protein
MVMGQGFMKLTLLVFLMSFQMAQYILAQDSSKPKFSCESMTTRTEIYQGKSYLKYNIPEAAGMRCPQIQATRPAMPWKILKTKWSQQDELGFMNFIQSLGRSTCNTVEKCLSQSSNILRSMEDLLFTHYSDCADFPYYLRSYYAYKNGLPMSFTTEVEINPLSPEDQAKVAQRREDIRIKDGEEAALKYDKRLLDNRYSVDGNSPKAKLNIPNSSGTPRDFGLVGPRIMDQVSSATLRMLSTRPGLPETDFYSPKLHKGSIRPGTVLYNPSGHVAIVYDVTEKGEVLYIDAHPDNSVTRGSFGSEFPYSRMTHGGNFKNFRPFELVNVTKNSDGSIQKGSVRALVDAEISDYSLEQYLGNGINGDGSPNFKINPTDKKNANYYEWIKFKISGGVYRLDPVFEMKNEMSQLCAIAKDRVEAVQAAIDNKIFLKPHPDKLPANIYGTEGEWESYSTPGRDLRLRKKVLEIPAAAKNWLQRFNQQDPLIQYNGNDLKQDLIKTYLDSVLNCKIVYINSVGKSVQLGLETLLGRMTRLSYDPYACPERRWGATGAAELNSCADDQEKTEWHLLQQFLRNADEKDTTGVHGWSLSELASLNESKQADNKPQDERFKIGPKLEAM